MCTKILYQNKLTLINSTIFDLLDLDLFCSALFILCCFHFGRLIEFFALVLQKSSVEKINEGIDRYDSSYIISIVFSNFLS